MHCCPLSINILSEMISECPIHTGQCCDLGKSVLVEAPDSPTSVAYIDIMQSEWNYIIIDLNYLFCLEILSACGDTAPIFSHYIAER